MDKLSRKIVFIGGYGRSGSTLLCAVLGGADQTVSVGELSRIFSYYIESRKCACFELLNTCEFWKAVIEEFERRVPDISLERAAQITTMIESYSNWFLFRYKGSEVEAEYQRIWKNLLETIFDISGKNIIVDASKSSSVACNRAAALSKIVDLSQIHLVRDPRAVTSSTLQSEKRRFERHGVQRTPVRSLRTVLSWFSTNLYMHVSNRFGLMKINARTSYEALTNDPVSSLSELSETMDISFHPVIDTINAGGTFPAEHIFSGDLQRLKGDYTIKKDSAKWPGVLNKRQIYTCALTYPLSRSYGYYRQLDNN